MALDTTGGYAEFLDFSSTNPSLNEGYLEMRVQQSFWTKVCAYLLFLKYFILEAHMKTKLPFSQVLY